MTRALFAGFAVWAIAPVQSAAGQEPGLTPPVLEELRPLNPPGEVAAAEDVRWRADGGLLLGLRQEAVYLWTPGTPDTRLVVTLAGTRYRRAARYGNYSRLGGGPKGGLVFAGDLFGVYRQQGDRISALKANLEIVGDLDHRAGWTVAVGLARRAEPSPGSEDIWEPYVAWLFDAEDGARGLLPTRDGGIALDSCYPAELSVSRFVADDLVLVIPGAEPGAFLYGTDGVLRATVDLGLLTASRPDCRPDQRPLLYEERFRTAWLTRHRVIDEVAANDKGDVFFFVRHVDESRPVPSSLAPPNVTPTAGGRHGEGHGSVAGGESVGVGGRPPTAVALSLDSLPGRELEALLDEAGTEGGLLVLDADQAARLVATTQAQLTTSEGPRAPASSTSNVARAGVCWDIVHARVEDLSRMSTAPCAVQSGLADARLRVDLAGDRAVLLVRGATRLASAGVNRLEAAEFFEARLRAGS